MGNGQDSRDIAALVKDSRDSAGDTKDARDITLTTHTSRTHACVQARSNASDMCVQRCCSRNAICACARLNLCDHSIHVARLLKMAGHPALLVLNVAGTTVVVRVLSSGGQHSHIRPLGQTRRSVTPTISQTVTRKAPAQIAHHQAVTQEAQTLPRSAATVS